MRAYFHLRWDSCPVDIGTGPIQEYVTSVSVVLSVSVVFAKAPGIWLAVNALALSLSVTDGTTSRTRPGSKDAACGFWLTASRIMGKEKTECRVLQICLP